MILKWGDALRAGTARGPVAVFSCFLRGVLACSIWPGWVKQVCPSLAIAHGLEDLYEIKPPEKKAKAERVYE